MNPINERADNPVGYPSYALTATMTRHNTDLRAPCNRVWAIRAAMGRSPRPSQMEIYDELTMVECSCGMGLSSTERLRR